MVFYFIVFSVLILDQVSKIFVVSRMEMFESIPVINNIFHITLLPNYGAAFGILPHQRGFFIGATLLVIVVIIFYIRQVPPQYKYLRLGLALQLGGAIGNLVDRIRLGYVIDFFDFRIWPVFNIADMAIVIGVCLLAIDLLKMTTEKGS